MILPGVDLAALVKSLTVFHGESAATVTRKGVRKGASVLWAVVLASIRPAAYSQHERGY
jgi:hypothetical protein